MGREFKPGQSGNPNGRPKGSKDKRTALRALLEPHAEDLVKQVVDRAKKGDMTALRLCLDRLIPPYRAQNTSVELPALEGALVDQGQQIISAMGRGEITPSDASSMLQALGAQARIREADEMVERLERLEEYITKQRSLT